MYTMWETIIKFNNLQNKTNKRRKEVKEEGRKEKSKRNVKSNKSKITVYQLPIQTTSVKSKFHIN